MHNFEHKLSVEELEKIVNICRSVKLIKTGARLVPCGTRTFSPKTASTNGCLGRLYSDKSMPKILSFLVRTHINVKLIYVSCYKTVLFYKCIEAIPERRNYSTFQEPLKTLSIDTSHRL